MLRVWAAALLFTIALQGYIAFRPEIPQTPVIDTTFLDPAVEGLIQRTLDEVRATPRSGAAWGKLGSVLMHYEFIDETVTAFERAAEFSPDDPRWPYLHALAIDTINPDLALNKLRRATELTIDRPDMPRLRLAQSLTERGLNEEAETHFKLLLQSVSTHPMALLGLARLRQAQGQLSEATNLLSKCLNDPHTSRGAHAVLAMIEQALGNVPTAEAAARASSSLPADLPWPDPWWSEALVWRVGRKAQLEDASALIDRGAWLEAQSALERMTREFPNDDEPWYLMGWAFNQLQRGPEAEKALREHLRLSPQSPKGHAQLAVSLLSQRRHAEAVAVLEAGLKLKPTWRELHSNMGYACVQLGHDDDAISHYRNALALDPNYIPSHTALAELLARRSRNGEARQLLQRALELSPSDERLKSMLKRIEADQ